MQTLVLPPSGTDIGLGAIALLRRARAARLAARLAEIRVPGGVAILRFVEILSRSAAEHFSELLAEPTIGVLVDTGRDLEALATLAFDLACQKTLPEPLELPPLTLCSMRHGLILEPGRRCVGLTLRAGGAIAKDSQGGQVSLMLAPAKLHDHPLARLAAPFAVIREPIKLAFHDPNPLSSLETHPEKEGNRLSLGDSASEAWVTAIRAALDSLDRLAPELAAEMQLLLRAVIPTGTDGERQLSASYREYVGAVYLTLHPHRLSTLEALVHEFQHNKLNLCAQHYALIDNAYEPLYPSPVRPDPRPLMGVLLAAHAFVPVAELYRRLLVHAPADHNTVRRLSEIVTANDEALGTLGEHARWAPVGARIYEELSAWHASHKALGLPQVTNATHV